MGLSASLVSSTVQAESNVGMKTLAQIEKAVILARLIECEFHPQKTAKSLQIGKTTIYRKLESWGLKPRVGTHRQLLDLPRSEYLAWQGKVMAEIEGLGFSDPSLLSYAGSENAILMLDKTGGGNTTGLQVTVSESAKAKPSALVTDAVRFATPAETYATVSDCPSIGVELAMAELSMAKVTAGGTNETGMGAPV